MFRRAFLAEQLALRGLKHAFENFSALRCFGVGNSCVRNWEALLGVPLSVFVADPQSRLGDEPKSAPFKIGPQLKYLRHCFQGGVIAFPRNDAFVLILDARFA